MTPTVIANPREGGGKQSIFFREARTRLFKKRRPKNFCNFYTGCFNVPRTPRSKVFLVLFLQKKNCFPC